MLDKFHCKIAYADAEDQLELGDFYDFTSSYPADEDEEWEDAGDEEDENMEVMAIRKFSTSPPLRSPPYCVMRRSMMTRSGTATPNSSWFSPLVRVSPPFLSVATTPSRCVIHPSDRVLPTRICRAGTAEVAPSPAVSSQESVYEPPRWRWYAGHGERWSGYQGEEPR